MLPFELTKDTPYFALSGELWSVFYEYFNRNWSCYKGFPLYYHPAHNAINAAQMYLSLVITRTQLNNSTKTIYVIITGLIFLNLWRPRIHLFLKMSRKYITLLYDTMRLPQIMNAWVINKNQPIINGPLLQHLPSRSILFDLIITSNSLIHNWYHYKAFDTYLSRKNLSRKVMEFYWKQYW